MKLPTRIPTKIIPFLVFMPIIAILSAGQVFGYGYNPISDCTSCHNLSTTTGPHRGYTSTGHKCKTCHAVHLATGAYKLTRANTAADACNFCHAFGGPHGSSASPYDLAPGGDPKATVNGHTIGESFASIPDGPNSSIVLLCVSCHSVHGAKAISFNDSATNKYPKILKNDPLNSGSPVPDTSTPFATSYGTLTAFCQKCHSQNQGSASHPYAPADSALAFSGAETCNKCHAAAGQPHATQSWRMLMGKDTGTSVTASNLDDNCRLCHLKGDLTAGVGITY